MDIEKLAADSAAAHQLHLSIATKMLMEDPRMQRLIGETGGDVRKVQRLMELVMAYGFSCGTEHFVSEVIGAVASIGADDAVKH